jgi:hypothetical protein
VTQTADPELPQSDDATTSFSERLTSEFVDTRVLARIANGIAVGGFLTALAGFIISSLLTIAVGLAGLALLVTAHQVGNKLFGNDQMCRRTLGTDDGIGVAAALVGGAGILDPLPGLNPVAYGAIIFLIGFVLFVAVWEYE